MISGTALITGADGFVGPYLSTQLRLDGWVVKGIDITDDKRRGCSVIDRCDIRDEEMLVSIIERDEPDRIFHLASLSHIPRSWESPKLVCDINLMGLINLMESLRNAHSKSCALIVGSAMEYGASLRDGTPVSEDAPLRPENPFATSKAAQDLIASQYCQEHGINVVRVRPFMHTGPWQQDMFLVPYLCRQVARIRMGLVRELVAPPEDIRYDITDVRDMANAYMLALDKGERGDVYNIASGQVYSIGEIVEELKGISGLDFPVRHETQIGISDLLHHFVGDGQKFRNATGWEPRIGLSQTLRDTYQHWLDNLPHT